MIEATIPAPLLRAASRLLPAGVKRAVNAGPGGRIVACGTGATGAIDKLQQILGVALPPATRKVVGASGLGEKLLFSLQQLQIGKAVELMAEAEGLAAHAEAVRKRSQ